MKYPNQKYVNYKNRGLSLEDDINITNEYYLLNNIAVIYKKPTPIKATKISYKNNKKIITEGYFQTLSTTDYNGLYKGLYIDFEAKETKNKTSFPILNLHKHQLIHIQNVVNHNGIAFIIVRFTTLNKTYLLSGINLINFINEEKRSSIPILYFEEKGYLITEAYQPRLDYLKIIDIITKE